MTIVGIDMIMMIEILNYELKLQNPMCDPKCGIPAVYNLQ